MKSILGLIVNYNGGNLLKTTLTELFATTEELVMSGKLKLDITLLDNASTDNSIEMVQKDFPKIKVILNGENLGFGKALNVGLRPLLNSNSTYDYVLLFNPDLSFQKGWLEELLKTFQTKEKEKVAAVAPLILYQDKFWQLKLEVDNPVLFVNFPDYRMPSPVTGNITGKYQKAEEKTLFGKQFHQFKDSELLLNVAETFKDNLQLTVYDETLAGYKLQLPGLTVSSPKWLAKIKKVLFKLNPRLLNLKIKTINYKLPEKITAKEPEDVVNSFGSYFKKNAQLPDNKYFGFRKEDAIKAMGTNNLQEVQMFHGACVLINTKALKESGIFDEKFFMFYEESDLSLRMVQKGWKIFANARSIVHHYERGSKSAKIVQWLQESQVKFVRKWQGSSLLESR